MSLSNVEEISQQQQQQQDQASHQAGVAGRTNYAKWDKVASELVKEVEQQDLEESEQEKAKLGLDGKYARSKAEAEEREKLKQAKRTKKTLERFKKRENAFIQSLSGLLGPVSVDEKEGDDTNDVQTEESKDSEGKIVRITRDIVDAGKRVVCICDTSGTSIHKDTIVMTLDLSHLESKMKANALLQPKSYKDDAENIVPDPLKTATTTTADKVSDGETTNTNNTNGESEEYRKILGIIKLFISNVHNCTIILKCKIITGTVEMHNCTNVKLRIESTATVATVQADLCEDIIIEFWDAPSGKNVPSPATPTKHSLYWGEDKDDRIFHAGIRNMKVCIYRDDYLDSEILCDYIADGAESIGNASAKEFQFVTSCLDGRLITEKVVRTGASTGTNVRAMTERELEREQEKRERAAKVAVRMAEDMVQIKDKDGNILVTKNESLSTTNNSTNEMDQQSTVNNTSDEVIEEIYTSMTNKQIQEIIAECDELKKRGNEAFGAGEYVQAILHYTLSLEKSYELPDYDNVSKTLRTTTGPTKTTTMLYPRDVILSNRSACFLKLGQHDKAENDASVALTYNPDNIKANFRLGLSLHAQSKYSAAIPILAKAYKIEPKNKQIQQALQFCEVRLEQERRKYMEK